MAILDSLYAAGLTTIQAIRRLARNHNPGAIDPQDPIGGALHDAEVLVAFAAQSSRNIAPDKVLKVMEAAQKIKTLRAGGTILPATDVSQFWSAYDELAADMAPVSAHSIKSSMQVNCRRFPLSLFTPTSYNASVAILVFLLCLALQGFWVAGKELLDRADAIETQRHDVIKRMLTQAVLQKRALVKVNDIEQQMCESEGRYCEQANSLSPHMIQVKTEPAKLAELDAQHSIAQAEKIDATIVSDEINDELQRIADSSRPLESLLTKWHDRARSVCNHAVIEYLCPVDYRSEIGSNDALRQKVSLLRKEVDDIRLEKPMIQTASSKAPVFNNDVAWQQYVDLRRKEDQLRRMEADLVKEDADRFRRIAIEVRIIVGNLGTYLIAMTMGILGALAYILRNLSYQLRDHTYVPLSISISIVRICLGAIAGVFGSLLAPGDPTLKTLPPLFIPFAFGYGIEILFSLLDRIVKTFTQNDANARPDAATRPS